MEELTIVRKRTRLWPILLVLIVLAIIAVVVLYAIGSTTTVEEFGLAPGAGSWRPLSGGMNGTA